MIESFSLVSNVNNHLVLVDRKTDGYKFGRIGLVAMPDGISQGFFHGEPYGENEPFVTRETAQVTYQRRFNFPSFLGAAGDLDVMPLDFGGPSTSHGKAGVPGPIS